MQHLISKETGLSSFKKIYMLGLANSGKSTILNTILQQPICSTSKLAQTTRQQMYYEDPKRNIFYIDSPGLVKKSSRVESEIKKLPWKIHADYLFFILDSTQRSLDSIIILELQKVKIPIFAVFNKMDLIQNNETLMEFPVPVEKSISISAIENKVEPLLDLLNHIAPIKTKNVVQKYDSKQISEEAIREQLYQNIYSYLPYMTEQRTVHFQESDSAISMIHELKVERLSQSKILKGQKGRVVRTMETLAASKIEKLLGKKVNLDIIVNFRK
eukprot:NODE_4_length_77007_cov_1.156642.p39 type:complete len:272 gc:universal NODE_4_length_77007_cov_1.156642:8462-7647(-)